jgi:hypothetical protein
MNKCQRISSYSFSPIPPYSLSPIISSLLILSDSSLLNISDSSLLNVSDSSRCWFASIFWRNSWTPATSPLIESRVIIWRRTSGRPSSSGTCSGSWGSSRSGGLIFLVLFSSFFFLVVFRDFCVDASQTIFIRVIIFVCRDFFPQLYNNDVELPDCIMLSSAIGLN